MQQTSSYPARLIVFLTMAGLSQPACSLFDSDFEGSVRLLFEVDDPDNTYESVDLFDPNDNEDFRENRDRIRSGQIESMEFRFLDIEQANRANFVLGQADVRPVGEESTPWVEGVSAWEGVQVLDGNVFYVDIPGDRQAILTELIFEVDPDDLEPLEVRIDGRADDGPVRFNIQVTLNMSFTAGI